MSKALLMRSSAGKNCQMQLAFVAPAKYSEPRFPESFMNSQQSILSTSVGKNSRFSTLNR